MGERLLKDMETQMRIAEHVSNRCRECDASDPCRFCLNVAHWIMQLLAKEGE